MASAPMTAEEAVAKAKAEGLVLVCAGNTAGYKGVYIKQGKRRPYQLMIRAEGREKYFGSFATAEEAALHVARSPEGQAQAEVDAKVQARAEAKAQAEATLAAAGITGAKVATEIINLSNQEAALRVDVTADYEGLWGYVEIGAEYAGSATYRLDYQPLNPSPGF